MKIFVTLVLLFLSFPSSVFSQKIAGPWNGVLEVNPLTSITLVFNISVSEDGETCTIDSPDQGAYGISAIINYLSDDYVNISIPKVDATYTGKKKDGKIFGTFTQKGIPFTLNLISGTVVYKRPQTPKPPYPYATEDVMFCNKKDDVELSGTLTLPFAANKKKVPVVLLVTGSGQQNRDEELFAHKPFLVIADYLARNGIASLRYDDRGIGKSTGNMKGCTTADFMNDADAGLNFLRQSKRFKKVGVVGHSEGGMIAFMLGARGLTDFVVALAAPGLKGDSVLAEQNCSALKSAGINKNVTSHDIQAYIEQQGDSNRWLRFFADYDPKHDLSLTRCPVMALYGSLDKQVLPASNLSAVSDFLPKNKYNVTKKYAGLNHLFQHSKTGMPDEYSKIEETFSIEVLADMTAWIKNVSDCNQ